MNYNFEVNPNGFIWGEDEIKKECCGCDFGSGEDDFITCGVKSAWGEGFRIFVCDDCKEKIKLKAYSILKSNYFIYMNKRKKVFNQLSTYRSINLNEFGGVYIGFYNFKTNRTLKHRISFYKDGVYFGRVLRGCFGKKEVYLMVEEFLEKLKEEFVKNG